MNIFKILASGDGSINEPNVSAFLSYLINPNEDHGLRNHFLKKILLELIKNNLNNNFLKNKLLIDYKKMGKHNKMQITDDDIRSFKEDLSVDVYLEEAFKQNEIPN